MKRAKKPREIPTHPDALLTEKEVAELLGFSPRTLQAWRTDGIELEFVEIGRSINVPVWAVEAAIRRFHRNDWPCDKQGQRYPYRWCPPPADLRDVAYSEMLRVEARAKALERIIQAVPPIEFSDEHCAKMSARFAELLHKLKTSPVGKDGSGGAAGRRPVDGAHCGTRPKAQPGLKREGGRRRGGERRK